MRFGVLRQQTLLVTTELVIWRYANAFIFTNQSQLDFAIAYVYWNILTMHGPINVKSPTNISEWQMRFNSAFKGLMWEFILAARYHLQTSMLPDGSVAVP
jgi:hypothetical protein